MSGVALGHFTGMKKKSRPGEGTARVFALGNVLTLAGTGRGICEAGHVGGEVVLDLGGGKPRRLRWLSGKSIPGGARQEIVMQPVPCRH